MSLLPKALVNPDAQYLAELSQAFEIDDPEVSARLLQIARNLQSLEELSVSAYARGFREGNDSHLARSNVAKTSRPISPNLAEAIEAFKGEIKRVPIGVTALEDSKPEPAAKAKKPMQATLTLDDLDL